MGPAGPCSKHISHRRRAGVTKWGTVPMEHMEDKTSAPASIPPAPTSGVCARPPTDRTPANRLYPNVSHSANRGSSKSLTSHQNHDLQSHVQMRTPQHRGSTAVNGEARTPSPAGPGGAPPPQPHGSAAAPAPEEPGAQARTDQQSRAPLTRDQPRGLYLT